MRLCGRQLAAAVFLCAAPIFAQISDAVKAQLDEKIGATLAAFGAPSVSVAVVQDGRVGYAKAFGKANLESNRAADLGTRYAVGSISKQFTAAALLLAQEQGKLSIDDKVGKYLPDLTRANEVTIRQLLSHTSGYEDYAPQDYLIPEWTKPVSPDYIINRWAKKPLNFDPGTRWQYSNTNYVIAGKILEKATGKGLVPFLEEHIFGPLGMQTAGEWVTDGKDDASAYTRFALGPARPVGREAVGWYFAAGELSMTPSDLAKWDIAFLQKKILTAKSYDEFTREVKLADGKATHYALGLQLGEMYGTPMITHGGEVSGFLAMNSVFPEKKVAIVVLSNEDGVGMIGPVSREIGSVLLSPADQSAAKMDDRVRGILESLAKGEVQRDLFTVNANTYFTATALGDFKQSLTSLGKLMILSKQSENLRGGMTHLSYRAHFEKSSVGLNIYVMPDGKFEQFMVEEQF